MSRFPVASRNDHQRFCELEGWRKVRNAKGRSGTHHITYELALPDGAILRTRVSHPPDRSTYGKAMWSHILRDQLQVTEEEFWACVRDRNRPSRGQPEQPKHAVPAALVHQLVVTFQVPETEVATMTKQEAVERLAVLWSQSD